VASVIVTDLVPLRDRGFYQGENLLQSAAQIPANRCIGIMMTIFGSGSMIGGPLSGHLADQYGWQISFWIQVSHTHSNLSTVLTCLPTATGYCFLCYHHNDLLTTFCNPSNSSNIDIRPSFTRLARNTPAHRFDHFPDPWLLVPYFFPQTLVRSNGMGEPPRGCYRIGSLCLVGRSGGEAGRSSRAFEEQT
jgi:MFS family permease